MQQEIIKDLLETMSETIKKSDLLIHHSQFCLEEDRDELINQVNIQREVLIQRIHEISNSHIKIVSKNSMRQVLSAQRLVVTK